MSRGKKKEVSLVSQKCGIFSVSRGRGGGERVLPKKRRIEKVVHSPQGEKNKHGLTLKKVLGAPPAWGKVKKMKKTSTSRRKIRFGN